MNKHDLKDEFSTGNIIAVAIEVHKILGPGFHENAYHKALEKELRDQYIAFETEKNVKIYYKNELVADYKLDLFIESKFDVEIKTVTAIADIHITQVVSYLKATKSNVG